VIGEAASGLGVTDLVERLTPDVLILDLMLPGLSGLEVARQVSHRIPTTRILVLSMHANEAYVLQALSSGASGYILKDSSAQDLVRAIHEVMAGRRFLSPPLSERAIEAYMQKAQDALLDPYDALTSREREVLHLAAEGRTNAEIATELSISPRTAEVHRANLMRKLSLRNQTELIRYALRRGILPMDT
jgi:DNA-binding NarL/FixJ family response regulator